MSSGLISVTHYLIWTVPCRPRTLDSYLSRPKAVPLPTEGCYDGTTEGIRLGFGHYVPVSEVAPLCESTVYVLAAPDGSPPAYQAHLASSSIDFTSLFHKHADAKGSMYKSGFTSALMDVGCRLDSSDANRIFWMMAAGDGVPPSQCHACGMCRLTGGRASKEAPCLMGDLPTRPL